MDKEIVGKPDVVVVIIYMMKTNRYKVIIQNLDDPKDRFSKECDGVIAFLGNHTEKDSISTTLSFAGSKMIVHHLIYQIPTRTLEFARKMGLLKQDGKPN